MHKIKAVTGRLESMAKLKNNSNIIIDFAHTPDALEQSLIALKKQFKKEIVIVFGCGGERDKKKRFVMGKVAKKYCRKIFVTDDKPRNKNPEKIRNSIMKGLKNCHEEDLIILSDVDEIPDLTKLNQFNKKNKYFVFSQKAFDYKLNLFNKAENN